jgi:single-strand DNA-binding protein
MSFQKIIIMGNIGKDPELKQAGGTAICNFPVAVSKSWKDESGDKQEKTEWFNIVAFRKTAEFAAKYLTKGRSVLIEGEMQTRSWEKDGQKHYRTELIAGEIRFAGPSVQPREDAPAALDTSLKGPGKSTKDIPNLAPKFDSEEVLPF